MSHCQYFVFREGQTIERIEHLSDALRLRDEGQVIWLDCGDPSVEELTGLMEPLGLHPLAIEDCLDEEEVPKMEGFPSHTFILFNRFTQDTAVPSVEEVGFFLGDRFLVTVHSHGREPIALADRLERTVRRDLQDARKGPDFLLQVILDEIVDEKFVAIEIVQDRLDAIEDLILQNETTFQPGKLTRLRRDLLMLRKSLGYEREILVKICRRDSPYITEAALYDFRDIYDHLARFFEVIEICRELTSSIMEIHLATLSNQMAMMGNKTNRVMKRLTMITTVFMPLTLLAGIGGMSEWSMMTGPKNWPIAYSVFLVAMGVIGYVNYRLLKWVDAKDKSGV